MFCPDCRSEYRPGFTTCADCETALVESLPEEPLPDETATRTLVPLLDTRSPEELAELVSRLETAEIPYVVQAGTALALLDGARLFGNQPETWEARIWVARDGSDTAGEIAETLNQELREESERSARQRAAERLIPS